MITNSGKEIIAKYMLGQAPSYATHIGLGCGARPTAATIVAKTVTHAGISSNVATIKTATDHDYYVGDYVVVSGVGANFNGTFLVVSRPTADSLTYAVDAPDSAYGTATGTISHSYSKKQNMDFEMIRIPISSRGFVNEGGISKIAMAAEMPVEYRYEITEVALWSAGTNGAVTTSDSRILFTFANDEGWVVHNTESVGSTGPLPEKVNALDGGDNTGNINVTDPIFGTYADNESLSISSRKARQEGSRFLNYTIFMRGDTSKIGSDFIVTNAASGVNSHIHLDGRNFDLAKNSPNDQIKLALSVVPKEVGNNAIPYRTRVVVEFLTSEVNADTGYAKLTHEIKDTDLSSDNRYFIITKPLKDLEIRGQFSWTDVRITRVYVSVFAASGDTEPSDQYYVVLDAARFENVSTPNPLYVMSGYSVVDTSLGYPIVKIENTSNYIEFRLALGVL